MDYPNKADVGPKLVSGVRMREFPSKKGQDGNNVKTKATSTLIKHVIQFWS